MRSFSGVRRPLGGVLLLVFVSGCYKWSVQTLDPASYVAEKAPGEIRVGVAEPSGTVQYRVRNPAVADDTLRGSFLRADGHQWRPVEIPGFPLTQIQAPPFEVRKTDTLATVLLTVGMLAVVAGAVVAITFASIDWS